MLITVGKIVAKGKRIGFRLNYNGALVDILDENARILAEKGELDLKYVNGRFYFKDKSKTVSDLPVVDRMKIINSKVKNNVSIYTGSRLKSFVNETKVGELSKRNFVKSVYSYCLSANNRILMLSGLRGTGKTTGLLQVI